MTPSSWQDAAVVRDFLEKRRAAIPYGADQIDMMLHLVRYFRPEPRTVFDLGCGDGFVARAVLAVYPGASAVLIDSSAPMLERASTAMQDFAGRYRLVQWDMAEPIGALAGAGSADLVVSGYAIHHLPHERKRALYAEIFALLAPGGLFVNIEHVASATPQLEALWDSVYIDHIARESGRPQAQVAAEYYARPDRKDNILAPVDMQVGWLRDIGFAHADCFFKFLELAVFGGVKP